MPTTSQRGRFDKRGSDALYNPSIIIPDEESEVAQENIVPPSDINTDDDLNSCSQPDTQQSLSQDNDQAQQNSRRPMSQACSQTSVSSLYGHSGTDIDRLLSRMVRQNPSRAIPPSNHTPGRTFICQLT